MTHKHATHAAVASALDAAGSASIDSKGMLSDDGVRVPDRIYRALVAVMLQKKIELAIFHPDESVWSFRLKRDTVFHIGNADWKTCIAAGFCGIRNESSGSVTIYFKE